MANLLTETQDIMDYIDKFWTDVDWIGSFGKQGVEISIENFLQIAADTEYDSGYGWPEIVVDLVIVFNDGSWLQRAEYDGSEWWEYHKTPARPSEKAVTRNLKVSEWSNYLSDCLDVLS